MITTFITILAYIAFVICTFIAFVSIVQRNNYHKGGPKGGPSLKKLVDNIGGKESKWPFIQPCLIVSAISLAWLITTWIS